MADPSVKKDECEQKRNKIYEKFDTHAEKLDAHTKTLGEIHGGVKVLVVMLPVVGALIMIILAIVGWTAKDQIQQLRDVQYERRGSNAVTDTDTDNTDSENGRYLDGTFYMDHLDTGEEKGTMDPVRRGETETPKPVGGETGSPKSSGPDVGN